MHQLFIDFKRAHDSVRTEVLCSILIEFGIPMKLARLIKMWLHETCSRVRVGKYLSDMFPLRNGLKKRRIFIFIAFQLCLKYAIKRVKGNQDGLKLDGKYQLLIYIDDVTIMGGSVRSIQKNRDTLVVANKEICLEVNAVKTKNMVRCRY